MSIRTRNKISALFNMSSLTDIVFLLLIFFLLTSTLVQPNALKLLLPNSNSKVQASQSVSVSIDKNKRYYVDQTEVTINEIAPLLKGKLSGQENPTVVLYADKSVPIDNVVQVMNIANNLRIKMILATNPPK